MRVLTAMLCEAATVRENLLHILGGGVTIMERSLPGPLECGVALLLQPDRDDLASDHEVSVQVKHRESAEVIAAGRMGLSLEADVSNTDAPDLTTIPIVLPLDYTLVSQAGDYVVLVDVDGVERQRIHFRVVQIDDDAQ